MQRNIYLELADPKDAGALWIKKTLAACAAPGSERVPLAEAAGRVAAKAIMAERSSPAFHGAAMDGYAIRARDTFGASPRKPLRLEAGKNIWPVNTGQPLPEGTDAVIMIEDTYQDGGCIVLEKAAFPWQHVRKTGEDIVATEVILAPGTLIGPAEIGALAAGGVLWPEVYRKPRVAIIPSGSDLVALADSQEEDLQAGRVLPEFNSLVFSAMLQAAGAESQTLPITPDDPEAIRLALEQAADADLVILNAGTSAGSRDYSAQVLAGCGEVLVHGVKMMPGKPVVLGLAHLKGRTVPVAGIPGYPVSAFMAMEEFVLPLLAAWQKREPQGRETMTVLPVNPLPSRPGMEERLRVKLGIVDCKAWAVPLPRGAGTVTSLSRADAIVSIPPESEGLDAGQPAEASLLRPAAQIKDSLLAIGSHDNSLDLIDSLLRRTHPRFRLTSAHVGSLGGLLALGRGQAHLAGTHLLDPQTGIYNQKAIRENLAHMPVALVRLADREQGLILRPGNPMQINSLADLADSKARFINRQRGSGTRVLLDYQLDKLGIRPVQLQGYNDEEYTHMNIAQAVLSGRADAGLGVRAAANALGLDFIPVGNEEYDLAIPLRYMGDERIQALLAVIRSQAFRDLLAGLGGYVTERTGEVIWQSGD